MSTSPPENDGTLSVQTESLAPTVLANFQALFNSVDFNEQLKILGIGKMQFVLRKQVLLELQSLFVALWRLALDKSFPQDGSLIYEAFLDSLIDQNKKDTRQAHSLVQRVRDYVDMLSHHKDSDFSEVSAHLASFVQSNDASSKQLRLRLALNIRALYMLIFDRLI